MLEPMAVLSTAPKQDSLHTNIPIRVSASCPVFDHRKLKNILFALYLDILCVCETHLIGNENIVIEG